MKIHSSSSSPFSVSISPRNFRQTSSKFARGILNPMVRSTNFYLLSRGKLIVGFENRASPSHPPFHHSLSILPSFVFKRDLSSLAPCKSCSARKFLLLQLNSRTLVIYVNKNTVPFREGGGDAVEYFILVVGRVGGGGEEGERIVVSTTILENSCGRRNWSTRFTLDPLP